MSETDARSAVETVERFIARLAEVASNLPGGRNPAPD